MPRHAFSVEEANALLPHVRSTLREIRTRMDAFRKHADRSAVLELVWDDRHLEPGHPDHDEHVTHRRVMARLGDEIEHLVRDQLTGRGIRFPAGGLEHGLVDFPTTLDGRWIYLCWHVGEERVEYWHDLSAGFAGRQPITPQVAGRIGLEDDPALEDDSALDF